MTVKSIIELLNGQKKVGPQTVTKVGVTKVLPAVTKVKPVTKVEDQNAGQANAGPPEMALKKMAKKKMGRPLHGDRPMTAAERAAAYRRRKKENAGQLE